MAAYNQGRLSEAQRCPRRYYYRFELKLGPKEPSNRLQHGTNVHAGIAAHYRGADPLAAYDAAVAGFKPASGTEELFAKEAALWRERVARYPQRWAGDNFRVIGVEQEIVVPLGPHQYVCRLDLLIERPDGSIWVMDHKTAAKTGASYYPQYFVDLQGSGYVYAAQKHLGRRVSGWIINAVKSTKEGWYERETFTRTDEQIASFERQATYLVDSLEGRRAAMKQLGNPIEVVDRLYPQHTQECHTFGGTCVFLGLCQAGEAALPLFVPRSNDYVDAINRGGVPGAPGVGGSLATGRKSQ